MNAVSAAADRRRPAAPALRAHPTVLVAGNPNAGKSTLFNALTGATTKVSNYPGVTVARASATMQVRGLGAVELVDLPGTYSLSARSRDEQVAVDAILGRTSAPPRCRHRRRRCDGARAQSVLRKRDHRDRHPGRRGAQHDGRGRGNPGGPGVALHAVGCDRRRGRSRHRAAPGGPGRADRSASGGPSSSAGPPLRARTPGPDAEADITELAPATRG